MSKSFPPNSQNEYLAPTTITKKKKEKELLESKSIYLQETAKPKDVSSDECFSQYEHNLYEDLNLVNYEYSIDLESPTLFKNSRLPLIPSGLQSPVTSTLETSGSQCNEFFRATRNCPLNSYQLQSQIQSTNCISPPPTYENNSSRKPSKSSCCLHFKYLILLLFLYSTTSIILSSYAIYKIHHSELTSVEYADSTFLKLQNKINLLNNEMSMIVEQQKEKTTQITNILKSVDLSNCMYGKKSDGKSSSHPVSSTEWIPFSEDLNKYIVTGVHCSVNGGESASLEVRNQSNNNQYQCICKGALTGFTVRHCLIQYWICPRIMNVN